MLRPPVVVNAVCGSQEMVTAVSDAGSDVDVANAFITAIVSACRGFNRATACLCGNSGATEVLIAIMVHHTAAATVGDASPLEGVQSPYLM